MWVKGIATILIAVSLSACQSGPFRKKSPASENTLNSQASYTGGVAASAEQRFDDVPLPKKSTEDVERTFVYRSRLIEIGRMVYTTRLSVNEVSQFYIDACAGMDWKLENVLQAEGVQLLFTKPGKRLFVSARSSNLPNGRTLFIVNLIPEDESGATNDQPFRVNTSPLSR